MDVKQNLGRLTDETSEYVNLRIESTKLYMVETISLFASTLISRILFFVFLTISFIFMLVALMLFLSTIVGYVVSSLLVSLLLLVVAIMVYANRKRMFGDMMVNSLCRIFFPKSDIENETY